MDYTMYNEWLVVCVRVCVRANRVISNLKQQQQQQKGKVYKRHLFIISKLYR